MTVPERTPRLEVLHVSDCPNLAPLLARIAEVTDAPVITREISTDTQAEAAGMAGSPTLLINGIDPFATPQLRACGLACRLYRDELGRLASAPSVTQLRAALARIGGPEPASSPDRRLAGAGELFSRWRRRACPLEPVDKAVHQATLRSFAATGAPPSHAELAASVDHGHAIGDVLTRLHDLDAIRLDPTGHIAVAYPFSASPTRHHVRIADHADVYAMCAIDALGIAAMLGQSTHIESFDATTADPITVITECTAEGSRASWHPAAAVVFICADSGVGPSVDCCCDYLNFFTDHDTATAWTAARPDIPGQILTQAEAEKLGTRLFGHLLND